MNNYMKIWEFFELEKEKAILQCLDYKLKRVNTRAIKFIQYGAYKSSVDLEYLQYVNTIIVKINYVEKTIKLNSDGWYTITTKKHINNIIN